MGNTTAGAITELSKTAGTFAWIYKWFANPEQTKKQADADAYAIERAIEVAEKHPGWNILYKNGKLNLSECTHEELINRAKNRMLEEAIIRESNQEKVLTLAINEVQQSEKIPEKPIDEDWLTRFFHIVGNVSSEEIQVVWSKILAGEIIQPGRFSLRTLETIRNVSKDEAEIFQKIIPLVMSSYRDCFISSDEKILNKHEINYLMLLKLDDAGLLKTNYTNKTYSISKNRKTVFFNDEKLVELNGKDTNEVKLSHGIYLLTQAGYELYKILKHEINDEYVYDLAKQLSEQGKDKVKISVYKVKSYNDREVEYEKLPLYSFTS